MNRFFDPILVASNYHLLGIKKTGLLEIDNMCIRTELFWCLTVDGPG